MLKIESPPWLQNKNNVQGGREFYHQGDFKQKILRRINISLVAAALFLNQSLDKEDSQGNFNPSLTMGRTRSLAPIELKIQMRGKKIY